LCGNKFSIEYLEIAMVNFVSIDEVRLYGYGNFGIAHG